MIRTVALLAELKARNVRGVDIARALDVPTSRVSEMYRGARRITLEEAATLVETFGLEDPALPPLSPAMAALMVRHVIEQTAQSADRPPPTVESLAQDLIELSALLSDPDVRDDPAAVRMFLRGRASATL